MLCAFVEAQRSTDCADAEQAKRFYCEVKKRLTDFIKALLGIKHLNLWEDGCMVAEILDVSKVKDRIAYLYSNPSAADLEVSIDRYPGVSSWQQYTNSLEHLDASHSSTFAWLQLPHLQRLPSPQLSDHQDKAFANKFRSQAKLSHDLTCKPNDWMKAFGISEPEQVKEINQAIVDDVRRREKSFAEKRALEGRSVIKAHCLRLEPILKPHTPKTSSRNIFVLSSNKSLRIDFIRAFKEVCDRLRSIYLEWKLGDFSSAWPPGWFKPSVPILANAV